MKILTLGTLTNSMNGSARSFVRIVNGLAKNHEVYVVLPDDGGVCGSINANVKDILIKNIVPIRRSVSYLVRLPLSIWRLFKILKEIKPDIVHVNDIPWFYVVGLIKIFNIPVIIHSRYYEKNKIVKSFISYFLSKADAMIYVSNFNKSMWDIKAPCQYVVHNPGVFDFKLAPFEGLPKNYALLVCRISEEKGVLEAIKLFSLLNDKEMVLVIAGDALYEYQKTYLLECRGLVESLGLMGRVLWLGNVDFPHNLYVNAAVYIHMPNFEDPFPTTIMEALALGCRIITNGRGGIQEQVAGFSGICLFSPSDSMERVSSKIEKFLNDTPRYIDRSSLYKQRFSEREFHRKFAEILELVARRVEGV